MVALVILAMAGIPGWSDDAQALGPLDELLDGLPPGLVALEMWEARYDGPVNGWDVAIDMVFDKPRDRLYVTGHSTGLTGFFYDYATVAYDATTGTELWVARYEPGLGEAIGVSGDGSTVFVTGRSLGDGTNEDYATIAYDAQTGQQLWVDRYDGPVSGPDRAYGLVVSPDGETLIVTGESVGEGTGADYVTIAYDTKTGDRRWLERYDGPASARDIARAITIHPEGDLVYVTGNSAGVGTGADYKTIAYDAASGDTVWSARYDGPAGASDAARAIEVSPDGGVVVVTGQSAGVGTGQDFATVAYDAHSGEELWVMRHNGPQNSWDEAWALVFDPAGEKVFVTGYGPDVNFDFVTIGYDVATGHEIWLQRYSGPVGGTNIAKDIDISPDGRTVVVTGISPGEGSMEDFLTIAYDAESGQELWEVRYDGPAGSTDIVSKVVVDVFALDVDPVLHAELGLRVWATGSSFGIGTSNDYTTLKYVVVP